MLRARSRAGAGIRPPAAGLVFYEAAPDPAWHRGERLRALAQRGQAASQVVNPQWYGADTKIDTKLVCKMAAILRVDLIIRWPPPFPQPEAKVVHIVR